LNRPLAIAMLSHLASREAPTGAERSLSLLARGLSRSGHRVKVYAPGPWPLAVELRKHDVETVEIGCRCCWLTYHDPRPWPETMLRWARYAWPDPGRARLERALEGGGFDLVYVNCLPHLRGAAAGRAAGLPVVWHLREILPVGRRRRWLAGRLARHATRIVAVSEAVAQWVRDEQLGDRLDVVHNGTDVSRAPTDREEARRALGLPAEVCVIGLFGQLLPHKGPLEFIRAARSAAARDAGLFFVIAGAGPERFVERVREAAGTERSGGRIRLLPAQPDAGALFAASDVVCLATSTPDPFPRSVLEAMAAGRPVVAFRSGGTPELVEHEETGLLVEVGDVEGLAAAFQRLGSDGELRRRLGQRGRERAARCFSIESHVERMEALLRRTAAR
jgi:glycosyltransferase involved in cell wall biosynthesis